MKNKELIVDNGKLTMEDWEEKKLGEVAPYITKGTTPTTNGFKFLKGGISFVKIESIEDGYINHNKITSFISEKAHKAQARSILKENDILYSIAGTIGEIARVRKEDLPLNTNQALAIIRGYDEKIIPEFLSYILKSNFLASTNAKARGGALKNISLKDIKNAKVLYPKSLPEQRRIVSKLDGLFAEIDASLALIDQNIEQAEALKLSVLDEEFAEIKDECYEEKFENTFVNKLVGLVRNRKQQGEDKSIEYLKMNNITNSGNLDLSKVVKVDANKKEIQKFKLQNGDFLFNTRNSIELVGKTAVFSGNRLMVFNNNIMRVRFKESIDSKYINYQFYTSYLKSQLNSIKSGTTNVAAIYYKSLKNINLLIHPKLKTQQKIVQKLDALFGEIDALVDDYTQKRESLEALKSSLLDQAFKGKL